MKKVFILFALMACVTTTFAQFTLEGQYRPRTELRNGFKKPILPGQEPAFFTEHRARLIAGYKTDKLGFKMSLQDVRIWGETGQINKSDQLLSTHEAYGEYYASTKSTFRVGRQEVIYDGHRLFGSLDWAMQGRSLDAVRYLFNDGKGTQLDLMAVWNQTGYGDGAPEPAKLVGNDYRTMNGGGANPRIFNLPLPKAQLMAYYKKSWKSGNIGLMLLNDTYTSTDTASVTHSNFTIGITPNFSSGNLKFGGQFYYTGGAAGKTYSGSDYENIDLNGFMANLFIQHTGVSGKPMFGVDYLSGDDESTTEVEGWSPKYGTNHKFYGFMDYFYVGNGHGGGNEKSAGLIDVFLKTTFKLSEKTTLLGHLHYFASAEERTNSTTNESYKGGLGTELDLVLVRPLAKGLVLKAGYSQLFGVTETMKQLKFGTPLQEIGDMQSWGWIMLTFSPKFL
ncbi:alginate export family protein [Sunxiuqinia indica]|uniref:hypothetical protein n=1 Tax=Sunxiuqinia indica TaxID=2692584 RepID=UPI001357728D|nr:hypothetical protein [Sunxiuqinia indica]